MLYGKDADLSPLIIIMARTFLHIKDANKLGHTSWEGMVCRFSRDESNSFRIWNPKTRRVVESRNFVIIKIPRYYVWQCFPLPDGVLHYRGWKLQCLT